MASVHYRMSRFFLALWIACVSTALVFGQEGAFYDEVYDSQKRVRPQYQDVLKIYNRLSDVQKDNFAKISLKLFKGDNALHALPRVLTENELAVLKDGTAQRARAILLFLQDHYSGQRRYARAGIFPPGVLERIIIRSNEQYFDRKIDPAQIAMPYGPDIVRDHEGVWRVIEDNPGNIGGPGDLLMARNIMNDLLPEYRQAIPTLDNPMDYYEELISQFRSHLKSGERLVLYSLDIGEQADHEGSRLRPIYRSLGVDVVDSKTANTLQVRSDGVYLVHRSTGRVVGKVGYLIVNADHAYLDVSLPLYRQQLLIEEAQTQIANYEVAHQPYESLTDYDKKIHQYLRSIPAAERQAVHKALVKAVTPNPRTGLVDAAKLENILATKSHFIFELETVNNRKIPGIVQAILDKKVKSNYTPGVDFIGDKEFYLYVEKLIKFYLNQDPILKNIRTEKFSKVRLGVISLNQRVWRDFESDPKRFVVKGVDGRGGNQVWVGAKISPAEIATLKQAVAQNPESYILQEYTPLSQLPGEQKRVNYISDLRMISWIGADAMVISSTPWSRGTPVNGNGKVNLSDKGRELAVMVVPTPPNGGCNDFRNRLTLGRNKQ